MKAGTVECTCCDRVYQYDEVKGWHQQNRWSFWMGMGCPKGNGERYDKDKYDSWRDFPCHGENRPVKPESPIGTREWYQEVKLSDLLECDQRALHYAKEYINWYDRNCEYGHYVGPEE